ncbi:MAG: MarR family winged helix-turn-helix transcriptional regulator [Clostridia bacterium]|nr:MarR family winged helix-turn-helix transcriptional regulator [Clostridia bacterium]
MENERLFGLICYIHREMERRGSVNLAETGVSGAQFQAMIFIHVSEKHGKKVCQRDIEREINLRPSSVSSLIKNLEAQGYLTRTYSTGDARQKFVELTDKGREVCLMNKEMMDKNDSIIQEVLTKEEQEELKRILLKIADSIEGSSPPKRR